MNKTFVLYLFCLVVVALAISIPALAWLSPLTYILILPLGAVWFWKSEGRSLWDLGYRFRKGWVRNLVGGLLFGLAIPVMFQVIQVIGGWVALTPRGEPLRDLPIYLLGVLIKMVFIVAIEEFVFRGFFLQSLSRRSGNWLAILLSSLLWGFGHLVSMVTEGLAPVLMAIGMTTFLVMGIVLSISFLKTGKLLWLPYGIHFGLNLSFSLIGWLFIAQYNAPVWWTGSPAWAPESGLIGILVWLILALIIWWCTSTEKINRWMADQ